MRKRINNLIFILVLLLFCGYGFSQEYIIRNYGVREGISHPFVYTINQDKNGFIWVGTGEGICRFDGFAFSTDVIRDSVSMAVAQTSYKDSRGILWIGFQTGDIIGYDGNEVRHINTGDDIKSSITGFAELEDGNLVFASQNGVYLLNTSTGEVSVIPGIEQGIYISLMLSDATLLLGKQEGLAVYVLVNQGEEARLTFEVNELEYTRIQDIQKSVDRLAFWIATEDQGLFNLSVNNSGYQLVAIGEEFKLAYENIQSVFEDPDGNIWLSTMQNGIYRLTLPDDPEQKAGIFNFNEDNGLISNNTKKVFQDLEGNLWIATYGDGLTLMAPQVFSFFNFEDRDLDNDIQAIYAASDNNVYMGGMEGLFKVPATMDMPVSKISGIPADRITALWQHDQDLLIGTANNGLYAMDIVSSRLRKINYNAGSLGNWVNSIAGDAEHIYLGTRDGIYQLDKSYQEKGHYTTLQGLPYNNVASVYLDRQNRLLFATRTDGIYQLIAEDTMVVNVFPAGESEIEFMDMVEDQNGNLWAATSGTGVFYFEGDSVHRFTDFSGLKSSFCYSLVFTENQNLWIGHRMGVSRINTGTFRVSVYDESNIDMTGDCNQSAVCTDPSGRALFGTTEGVLVYDPGKEKTEKIPPFTNITGLLISDREYDFSSEIILPYSLYKLRIDFIGLHYSDPQSVTYQYKLEGYDLDWSEVTNQNYVNYPRIEDGTYTFYLRSYSNEGVTEESPASFTIRVKLPFWKTIWFISLSVIVVVLSVYLYIKVRERKQRQLQEYLEKELAARTKEVVEQKEVIEVKNRDITDSINYAKRIQTSMLPPVKRLQHYFSGCFVFYSPRDIVSGDFYWFDKVNENKFMIVCADSTGHGVPGAFMSMIGSTLIKDICTREIGNSPSQVLQALDLELSNTLNQNLDDGTKPSDGMDIIVCEIDLKTYYVRYASAMRPMIIYRNGEEIFVKGSRNSIGGHYEREDNIFTDEGLQLSKGDIIYMFSDGYSDQFGGPMGKKFKMVRLKNLLLDIHSKPMEEQYSHVNSTFNQWKESYEQVDDVLFMGIKI